MPKKHKLYFSVTEGEVNGDQIKAFFNSREINVRGVTCFKDAQKGAIDFKKKQDKENALGSHRTFSLEGCHLQLNKNAPGTPEKKKSPLAPLNKGDSGKSPETPVAPHFFNPYHFVNVSGYTPRYPFTPHDHFRDNCGKIVVQVEFASPGFIPDPDRTRYIISDDTLRHEDEEDTPSQIIHTILESFFSKHKTQDIRFDPDCRGWDPYQPEKYVRLMDENSQDVPHWQVGQINWYKESGGRRYHVETEEPNRWAHKVMDFFQINGKPVIPGSSMKGMLRNAVETLSNGCFPGYEEQDDDLSYTFHRLDVKQVKRPELNLDAVVLRECRDRAWEYVKVEQAKILGSHIFNRIGSAGESQLSVYRNRDGYFEKISIRGKDERAKSTGLHAYDGRKRCRGDIEPIAGKNDIRADDHSITEIKARKLSHRKNLYDKTFPFARELPNDQSERLWAIIRCKKMNFRLYKIKAVSNNLKALEKQLSAFTDPKKNPDAAERDVKYKISEIRIKTAFDIDTKTQHRAFFRFGERDFDRAVSQGNARKLSEKEVSQFRSLLQQRKTNSEKLPRDPENINQRLARDLPDNLQNGMLAFYHSRNKYLTYTTVPQKPYRFSPRDILRNQDKLACCHSEKLCPACQLFGTASLNQEYPGLPGQKLTAVRGKVSVSDGVALVDTSAGKDWVTLRPLSSPKPTYFPFYVIDNHGMQNDSGKFKDYDEERIHIGRKVYLHHHPDYLNYAGREKTNMNSTVCPIPKNSGFRFEITFTNLTNYELGLLLYSLDMKYKGEKTGYHLGMGKSLGLGSCRLSFDEVMLLNVAEYYGDLSNDGKRVLAEEDIRNAEKAYQYVQGANTPEVYEKRLAEVNGIGLNAIHLPDNGKIEKEYFSRKHAHEYHFLNSINIHPKHKTDLPILFAGGMDKGFEWYQNARKENRERLFVPKVLEAEFLQSHKHSLSG